MKNLILVTGATGFLGKYVVERLLKDGARVRAVDSRPSAVPFEGDASRLEFVLGDIRDSRFVEQQAAGVEQVFHLAALPSIARGRIEQYYGVNVKGTENVLAAALKAGSAKVLHVSSSTIYGIPDKCPLKEDDRLSPIGKYGRTKLEAENVCGEFVKKGLDVSIIRPRVIMGPGRIGIFGLLFNFVSTNKPVYTIGAGRNIFQFTDVEDMVESCILAARRPGAAIYNIGAEDTRPVRVELQELIDHAKSRSRIIPLPASLTRAALKTLAALGISPLVDEQFRIADRDFKLDTSRARAELGWTPRRSNSECLIAAYDWYIAHRHEFPSQYKSLFGVLGKFRHSQQGAFQKS